MKKDRLPPEKLEDLAPAQPFQYSRIKDHNNGDMLTREGRVRVAIEQVKPEIDCGRFPIKRIVGDKVRVEADILSDGNDVLSAALLYRKESDQQWSEVPMRLIDNDRWQAEFTVRELGTYRYTIISWVDRFKSWRESLAKKKQAGQVEPVEYVIGAQIIKESARLAPMPDSRMLNEWAEVLHEPAVEVNAKDVLALSDRLAELMNKYPNRALASTYPRELSVTVDREKARFSTWYEMFPRSCASQPGRHGTFKDCEERLSYIASMGFDVLYFPPIHPISRIFRKGKNNALTPQPGDPGSPWAIGAEEGGHKSIHPELGTLEDFRRLLARAKESGIEIALDMAFNCSRSHPYLKEHPEWFLWRPDGTVQYAENPPKKYQDIYPFNFETENWRELWEELKSIVLFWIEQGVRIFRMDNPHTKPFHFWEWLISEVKSAYPDVIFLSEAFTRPKIMYRLAKLGFTQSYTYFTWRNNRWELTDYFNELSSPQLREYFRPNLWPNTPDILTPYLQSDGKPAFKVRLVLAATLGSNYGIYGPAFELGENHPREPGSEEYLDSEKYEIKFWDINSPGSLKDFIGGVNHIRRENRALQDNLNLFFHRVDNEQIICYSKRTDDFSSIILVVANLDPRYTQSGWVELNLRELGVSAEKPYKIHDILNDALYEWQGPRNYVELNPHVSPAHIFKIDAREL